MLKDIESLVTLVLAIIGAVGALLLAIKKSGILGTEKHIQSTEVINSTGIGNTEIVIKQEDTVVIGNEFSRFVESVQKEEDLGSA